MAPGPSPAPQPGRGWPLPEPRWVSVPYLPGGRDVLLSGRGCSTVTFQEAMSPAGGRDSPFSCARFLLGCGGQPKFLRKGCWPLQLRLGRRWSSATCPLLDQLLRTEGRFWSVPSKAAVRGRFRPRLEFLLPAALGAGRVLGARSARARCSRSPRTRPAPHAPRP